jgi:hypothetical protein
LLFPGCVFTYEAPKPLIHPNLAEVYRRKVVELNRALPDKDTGLEAFELIRSLVAEITFTPENGQLRIDLRGGTGRDPKPMHRRQKARLSRERRA